MSVIALAHVIRTHSNSAATLVFSTFAAALGHSAQLVISRIWRSPFNNQIVTGGNARHLRSEENSNPNNVTCLSEAPQRCNPLARFDAHGVSGNRASECDLYNHRRACIPTLPSRD